MLDPAIESEVRRIVLQELVIVAKRAYVSATMGIDTAALSRLVDAATSRFADLTGAQVEEDDEEDDVDCWGDQP